MKIGIVADTHDNMRQVARAVELFNRQEVDLVLHAGDFVAPFAAGGFDNLKTRLIGVLGNCDGEKLLLRDRLKDRGELHEDYHELELEGKRIALMHRPKFLEALIASGQYDLIIYGHTHKVDLREGPPLVINPGECCGWTTGKSTVAIVDLAIMKADIHQL